MTDAERYRDLAAQARQLALITTTRETVDGLLQMAADYDRKAEDAERTALVPAADQDGSGA